MSARLIHPTLKQRNKLEPTAEIQYVREMLFAVPKLEMRDQEPELRSM